MEFNDKYKRRRGRTALAPGDKRIHTVTTRMTTDELAQLDSMIGDMKRGEWMRCAALESFRPIVPEPNIKKWEDLARVAANTNQMAKALNRAEIVFDDELFKDIDAVLNNLRNALIGVSE